MYSEYQQTLEMPVSEIVEEIQKTGRLLDQKEGLWKAVNKWQQMEEIYNSMPFVSLKKEDIANDLSSIYDKSVEILRESVENMVAKTMMNKIEHYQKILPHILALANPAIKPRHWKKLFEAVNQPYDEETTFSLAQLKEYNILAHEEIITEVSTLASGEYALETTLENIQSIWENMSFQLVPYHNKTKNIYVLSDIEDIQQQLEDHEITLTTMLGSEYVSGIRKRVENMKSKLSHVGEILEEWILCQQKWSYLEPIFAHVQFEVQRQLSSQQSKFKWVDRKLRGIMRNAQKDPKVLITTSQAGLMATLTEANQMMETIFLSLESYLDSKRLVFPRFFFLSNEEIFEIMSQIHDPQSIQPFLSKCFDNIKSLEFSSLVRTSKYIYICCLSSLPMNILLTYLYLLFYIGRPNRGYGEFRWGEVGFQ